MENGKKIVLSGIQPSGIPTIGNYVGALRNWPLLQGEGRLCYYCVANLHAITVKQDPDVLRENTLSLTALLLACGVDPKESVIFVQSDVKEHCELSWVLNCATYMGKLNRMTQFKDKSKNKESAPAGLFTYPILMAADILLYDTDVVPVGNDQKQHIELCRDIAGRINSRFPDTFVMPEGRFLKAGARIMALDDPTKKMSKSAENIHSRISLLDEPSKIKKSIMKATTDSEGVIRFDAENKPGISNLLNIYSVLSGITVEDLEKRYEGSGYGTFKKDLVDVTVEALAPIKARYEEIRSSQMLIDTLKDGAERADAIAQKTMTRVKENFGLGLK